MSCMFKSEWTRFCSRDSVLTYLSGWLSVYVRSAEYTRQDIRVLSHYSEGPLFRRPAIRVIGFILYSLGLGVRVRIACVRNSGPESKKKKTLNGRRDATRVS